MAQRAVALAPAPTPASVEDFLERLAHEFTRLSPQLQRIGRYAETNRASLTVDGIQTIAGNCNVQASAVVRFAKHFGFAGFSELQRLYHGEFTAAARPSQSYPHRIRSLVRSRRSRPQPAEIGRELVRGTIAALSEFADNLETAPVGEAVDRLFKARTIYLAAVRRAFPAAAYLAYLLHRTGRPTHLLSGVGGMLRDELRAVDERDAMVAVSFHPYGRETQLAARVARTRGAAVIAVTDSRLSPIARQADVILTVSESTLHSFRSLATTVTLCQTLFLALAARMELDLSNPAPHDEPHEEELDD